MSNIQVTEVQEGNERDENGKRTWISNNENSQISWKTFTQTSKNLNTTQRVNTKKTIYIILKRQREKHFKVARKKDTSPPKEQK